MRRLVLVVLLATAALVVAAVPVEAQDDAKKKAPTTCDLLTKKQVSKILGHKVVETALSSDKKKGAEECEYRTNYYQKPRFKDLGAPYKLQITTQPIAGIESDVDALEADPDSEAVAGLGARAFYTGGDDLIVVVGDLVLEAEVTNVEWSGNEVDALKRSPERAAMDLIVPLFAK